VKLPCPYCAQVLNLPDRFAGKVSKCPACQQSFQVPGEAAPVPAAASAESSEQTTTSHKAADSLPGDELALHSLMDQQDTKKGPAELVVCPKCQTDWKKGAAECVKCHYNVFVGGKVRGPKKRTMNAHFDIQKVFLWLFVAGLCYGGYWLYNHFGAIRRSGDKMFDDASRGHVEEQKKGVDEGVQNATSPK